jgi:hypothetical protein
VIVKPLTIEDACFTLAPIKLLHEDNVVFALGAHTVEEVVPPNRMVAARMAVHKEIFIGRCRVANVANADAG